MAVPGCAFCGASGQLVDTCVLDDKWSRSFGGEPVVALDHGWYTSPRGERVVADHRDTAKFFRPYLRALCDYCAHGWVEDVRWRAEPALLALARGGPPPPRSAEPALVRWSLLTALLAELLEGMPTAASFAQRAAVRCGSPSLPPIEARLFTLDQQLPSRVHLSQVAVAGGTLIQVISIDVAHLCALVVIPSDERAREVVVRSGLDEVLRELHQGSGPELAPRIDLAHVPHPQRVAVQRLCATSTASAR